MNPDAVFCTFNVTPKSQENRDRHRAIYTYKHIFYIQTLLITYQLN